MSAPVPDATMVYPPESAPRYAQLLYTSFDNGTGVGGGWQIKCEKGALNSEERQRLSARIATSFNVGAGLPQFPTPDEIESRAARLYYADIGPSAAAHWHSVNAGNDATGRPGNVMAHVLLDRDIAAPAKHRPIELWASPDWCRAYGSAEVAAAVLPEAEPRANPAVSVAAAVRFLTDTAIDRQVVFRVLLDAVYAAMAGGPCVVLAVGDYDIVPRWIAAVSFFMSPGTARRFYWTTHDTVQQAVTDLRRGVHLVVVDLSDVDELRSGDWIVLREDDEPTVAALGSRHHTATAEVTVTSWSVLAEGVLADEATAVALIAEQDSIAAQVGDHGLSPLWPLAVAVHGSPELAEFHADAVIAIAEDPPGDLGDSVWLTSLVATATSETAPADLTEACRRVGVAAERGMAVGRPAKQLFRILRSTPGQLGTLALSEVPQCRAVGLSELPDARLVLQSLHASRPDDTHDATRLMLRFAELLIRLGRPDQALADLLSETEQYLGARVPALERSVAILAGDPDISGEIRERVLRPAIARHLGQLDVDDLSFFRWLFNDENASPADIAKAPANPGLADRSLYPCYVWTLLARSAVRVPATRKRELAEHAIFMALEAEQIEDRSCRSMVTTLNHWAKLSSEVLADILSRWPQRTSPALADNAVCKEQVPVELLSAILASPVAAAESDDRLVQRAVAAAELRLLFVDQASIDNDRAWHCLRGAAPVLLAHIDEVYLSQIEGDLAAALAAIIFAGQSQGEGWATLTEPAAEGLRAVLALRKAPPIRFLVGLAAVGVVDIDWLAGQSLLRRFGPGFPEPYLFGEVTEAWGPGQIADRVISGLVARQQYGGPRSINALRDSAWRIVRNLPAEQAQRFFEHYPTVGGEWLNELRV